MWRKIRKMFFSAMLESDQLEKVKPLVESENEVALKLSAIVQMLYFGFSFISSLGLQAMADKRLVYGIGTIIPAVILIIYLMFFKKHHALLAWLIRFFCAGLFATALLCTLICTPGEMTILLLIFFFCVPMLFVAPPIEQVALVLCTDAVYFVLAPVMKTPEVLSIDMIDVAMFSTLSVILGVSHIRGRYRRYWLETEAVEVAEIRYQAAFVDPLTGILNRNAFNRDTEGMSNSSISSDFMFIALDINGLKTANDSMGHVAGDELIKGAADCLQKGFSTYGKVYRVGGDEFSIILNLKDIPAGELLNSFNRIVDAWSGSLVSKLSVSYGVVTGYEAKGLSFHEIELLADKRMYQKKSDYYKNAGIDRRTQ